MAENHLFRKPRNVSECSTHILKKHFKEHTNPDYLSELDMLDELTSPPEYIKILRLVGEYQNVNQAPPTATEIKNIISKLRNIKAYDDIPAEIFKFAMESEEMIPELESIFKMVWTKNKIPDDWGKARIECIFKNKGSRLEALNYRGISIGSTIGKIFSSLIM